MWEYQRRHGGELPTYDPAQGNECVEIAKELNEAAKAADKFSLEEIDEDVIRKTALFSRN